MRRCATISVFCEITSTSGLTQVARACPWRFRNTTELGQPVPAGSLPWLSGVASRSASSHFCEARRKLLTRTTTSKLHLQISSFAMLPTYVRHLPPATCATWPVNPSHRLWMEFSVQGTGRIRIISEDVVHELSRKKSPS